MSEKMASKIKALLTKAERSEFPEEAEAFSAKAAELMAEHAIDEATLESLGQKAPVTEIEARRYVVAAPYSIDRMLLISNVSRALGGYAYYDKQPRDGSKTATNSKDHNTYATILGTTSDVNQIEQMLESLNQQMERARSSAIQGVYFRGMGDKKVWNATFIRGYATRIGQRLRESYQAKIDEQTGSVALVLRNKQDMIQEKMKSLGLTVAKSNRQHSQSGWSSGQVAADRATIRKAIR